MIITKEQFLEASGVPREYWDILENVRMDDEGAVFAEIDEKHLSPKTIQMIKRFSKKGRKPGKLYQA